MNNCIFAVKEVDYQILKQYVFLYTKDFMSTANRTGLSRRLTPVTLFRLYRSHSIIRILTPAAYLMAAILSGSTLMNWSISVQMVGLKQCVTTNSMY
jgi:hypothetical protein